MSVGPLFLNSSSSESDELSSTPFFGAAPVIQQRAGYCLQMGAQATCSQHELLTYIRMYVYTKSGAQHVSN